MRRGSRPSEPSSTLMFWSSTTYSMLAPISSASIAEISTMSLVRTSSRMVSSMPGRLAGRVVAQISKQFRFAPPARHGVEHEAADKAEERHEHQAGRQD